jgi:hypothetical protein
MENIYAIILDGKVSNLIVAKPEFVKNLKEQAVEVTDLPERPSIGWLYDGTNFSEPEQIKSQVVKVGKVKLKKPPIESKALKALKALDVENIPTSGPKLRELLKKIIEALK